MTELLSADLAALLASVDLFRGLDRIALARLTAQVEPIALEEGATLFAAGDPGDSLFIVARGSFGVFTAEADDQETLLNTVAEGACIGEMALLTDEPRSATVRALAPALALRLDRDRFLELVNEQPSVAQAIVGVMSQRLRAADRARHQSALLVQHNVERELQRLDAEQRLRLLQASVLADVTPSGLEALFGPHAAEVADRLSRLSPQVGQPSAVTLRLLREQFEREAGSETVQQFVREAGERLAARGLWDEALGVLARHRERTPFVNTLAAALRAVPPLDEAASARWVERLTPDEAAQDPELALATAALHEERGELAAAAEVLQRAMGAALLAGDSGAGQRLTEMLARVSGQGERLSAVRLDTSLLRRRMPPRPGVHALLGIGLAPALVLAAATVGRDNPTIAFGLLFGAALALWNSQLLPQFAVSLALVGAWILWDIADPQQAVAGFASMDWIFVLGVLGIAVAIGRSGLLFRVGLLLLRRTPGSLVGQAVVLLATGLLLSPLLPEPRGRAALTGPLALAVAQASGRKDHEPAATILGLAAWIGSGPLMFLFLNAAPVCLLAWGLMPPEARAQLDWLTWLIAALPLGLFVATGGLAALFLVFRPRMEPTLAREHLGLQLAVLGPPTASELSMLAVLIATVVGWFLAPVLNVHVGVVAVFGLFAAVATRALDPRSFRELDWDFLVFYGCALSVQHVLAGLATGGNLFDSPVAAGLGATASGWVGPIHPVVFVVAVALVSLVVRLGLEATQAVLALGLLFVPLAGVVGIHPWIVVITLLATNSFWFLREQTVGYRVAFVATEGRLFTHAQGRQAALAFAAVTLLGLVLCLPYWQLLGLL